MNVRCMCSANTFYSKSCSVFVVTFCIRPLVLFKVVVTGGRETSSFTKTHRKEWEWGFRFVDKGDQELKPPHPRPNYCPGDCVFKSISRLWICGDVP